MQHFRSALDDAILLDGPELELAPNDALSFGLAVHELATNAAKYGALSVPGGKVTIHWQRGADQAAAEAGWAEVEWQETGGPPVASQRRRGFGTELIEKVVAHELRQPVTLDFAPAGVRCVLRVPSRAVPPDIFQHPREGKAIGGWWCSRQAPPSGQEWGGGLALGRGGVGGNGGLAAGATPLEPAPTTFSKRAGQNHKRPRRSEEQRLTDRRAHGGFLKRLGHQIGRLGPVAGQQAFGIGGDEDHRHCPDAQNIVDCIQP
ncbi:MAG: sensor histidine kinase [Mycobacterium sp.]|nr:sensor histidine kinase [Mycobacterium sp.]